MGGVREVGGVMPFPVGLSGQRVSVDLQISLSIWTCMIYKSLGNLWIVNNSLTAPKGEGAFDV